MFLSSALFFLFSIFCLLSSLSLIFAKNPVFSVLFLIFSFVNISCILFLFDFEFLPIVTLVIYVGAIAVLFLFVLMTLNIKLSELQSQQAYYLPFSIILGFSFLMELVCLFSFDNNSLVLFDKNCVIFLFDLIEKDLATNHFFELFFLNSNVKSVALALFADHKYSFLIVGFILLLAMISTIVLTLQKEFVNKSQSVYSQLLKNHKNTLVFFN